MKAYGYLRVSSKTQIKGNGFDRQEEVIRRYCVKKNINVVRICKGRRGSGTTFVLIASLFMVLSRDAHAYIDPGTGSLALQILIASIISALFTFKLWLGAVKRFFLRLFGVADNTSAQTDEPSEESIEAIGSKGPTAPVAEEELEKKL
jgi:hypothetical protein